MGEKGTQTRDRLLNATQELVESGGYFGAGLNQVIAASGAPRGSLYFHFPAGKDELVAESIRRAGQSITEAMEELAESTSSVTEFIEAVLRHFGERLTQSSWRKGCPVATVALEMAAISDPLQEACAAVYSSWEAALREKLADRTDAEDLAVAVLAMVEGALLLARAHRSNDPLIRVGRQLAVLLG